MSLFDVFAVEQGAQPSAQAQTLPPSPPDGKMKDFEARLANLETEIGILKEIRSVPARKEAKNAAAV